MYRTSQIDLNSGQVITIASCGVIRDGHTDEIVQCYDEGNTMPCSILNASTYRADAMNKSIITSTQWNDFSQFYDDDHLASDWFIELKTYISDNTVWLWGDIEEGGFFFYNGGNSTKCGIGCCYGFVKSQADESYKRYEIRVNDNGFTVKESTEIAFYWETPQSFDKVPSLGIWYINDYFTDNIDSPIYGTWSVLNGHYEYAPTDSLNDLIGDNSWRDKGLLTEATTPSRVWTVSQITSDLSLIQKTLYADLNDNDVLYGSIMDDSEVNPSLNPSYKGGTTPQEGFEGDYPTKSDDVDFADPENDVDVDAVNSGFITLYNPTKTQIKQFSDFLWTDITDNISQQIKRLIANPLDAVLFIAMCHFTPPVSGVGSVIKYCGISSGVSSNLVSKQYFTLDCGSLEIGEDCDNFLDYNPYSKAHLFLPYVGINALDVNDLKRSTVKIHYNIDLVTGSALAQVRIERNERREGDAPLHAVLYDFPCNVYEQLPLSGSDWRQAVGNMTSLITGAVGVATGNGAGLGAMASAVASQQVSVVRSGSASGNYGYISNQKPYLILERPIENIPVDFPMYEGFTCNITYKLGTLRGYTEVDTGTWKSDWILGTEEEMNEIKELLDGGVFL